MANYCGCVLNIRTGNAQTIDELIEVTTPPKSGTLARLSTLIFGRTKLEGRYGLLEFMFPMPETLRSSITNGFSGPTPPWQQWQVDNWGCAYDVAVDSTNRLSPNEIQFRFASRYSPPIGAIEHGATKHAFQFRLVYCETGNQFAGIATENSHQLFEYSFEVHPRDEGVPEEIISEFDLDPIYQDIKEDEGR